jgi:hypothetical protein
MDEQEMQVYQSGAFEAMDGYKQIENGLSYFHLFSEQKWFPLGGTTKHKVPLKVAKDSVKPVKAAMLGPVFVKIGPDTNGGYHYIGGDEHVRGHLHLRLKICGAGVLQPSGPHDQE